MFYFPCQRTEDKKSQTKTSKATQKPAIMIPSPLPRWTFDVNSSSSDICGHDHFDHAAFKRAQYLNLMGSSEEGSTVRIRVAHESTLKNQLET